MEGRCEVKLYEVTIARTVLVLAVDAQRACHIAKRDADGEEPVTTAVEATRLPPGWTEDALVYGGERCGDVTVGEALQKYGRKPLDAATKT